MLRYEMVLDVIRKHKPETIVEIGTFNGVRALKMVQAALEFCNHVHYTGYDLFDTSDIETHKREFNYSDARNGLVKVPLTVEEIRDIFEGSGLPFTYDLIKGDTRETLREHTDDFVFIDGGHSVETIRSDYARVRGCKVVLFDDYYIGYPHTDRFGCNLIVDEIPGHIIHESNDGSVHGGRICLVEVVNY